MVRKTAFIFVLIMPAFSQAFTPPPFKANDIREGWQTASVDTSWGYSLGFLVPDFGKSLTTTFGYMWALDNKYALGVQGSYDVNFAGNIITDDARLHYYSGDLIVAYSESWGIAPFFGFGGAALRSGSLRDAGIHYQFGALRDVRIAEYWKALLYIKYNSKAGGDFEIDIASFGIDILWRTSSRNTIVFGAIAEWSIQSTRENEADKQAETLTGSLREIKDRAQDFGLGLTVGIQYTFK